MSQENVEVVRRVYEAAGRGDSVAVLALYDADVEWDGSRLPESQLTEHSFRGLEGLRRNFHEWREAWATFEDECEELIDTGSTVISVVARRGQGRSSGLRVETQRAGVWTVRKGKVVRVVWFPTRGEALEAAGLSE